MIISATYDRFGCAGPELTLAINTFYRNKWSNFYMIFHQYLLNCLALPLTAALTIAHIHLHTQFHLVGIFTVWNCYFVICSYYNHGRYLFRIFVFIGFLAQEVIIAERAILKSIAIVLGASELYLLLVLRNQREMHIFHWGATNNNIPTLYVNRSFACPLFCMYAHLLSCPVHTHFP